MKNERPLTTKPGEIEYVYHIGGDDRITAVDTNWLHFAQENDAHHLHEENVLGRPLWDFVGGRDVARLYKTLFERIRQTGKPADIPFRCDAPTLRRYMRLVVTTEDRESLHFTSILIREEPRHHQELLVPDHTSGDLLVRMCSWCKRVALPEGRWLEVEDAMVSLRVFETSTFPGVTHGICEACRDRMLNQWEADRQ